MRNAKPLNSEQRRRLRKRLEAEAKMAALRETGARCVNCRSYEAKAPYPGWKHEGWCSLTSDFHGYTVAKPNGLCLSHAPVKQAAE